MKKSIDRAIFLLGTPADYERYESIKIKPTKGGCCCFHCWPKTWAAVNEYISPYGPIQDEGDVLVNNADEKFVLECHESGPEIIYYTASILLIKSVIELVVALLKALEKEKNKNVGSLKIIRRKTIRNNTKEEQVIEINFPLNENTIKSLSERIRNK